jgi:hypothetical protein
MRMRRRVLNGDKARVVTWELVDRQSSPSTKNVRTVMNDGR